MKEISTALWEEIKRRVPSEAITGHHNERRTEVHDRIMELIETEFAKDAARIDADIEARK